MKVLITIVCACFVLNTNAQLIEDDAKVLDKEQGTPIFVLNAGEDVFTYEPENGWYKLRKLVVVNLNQVEGKLLNPGVTLRNRKGDSIGYTLSEIKVKELEKIEKFRGEDQYMVILEGYLFKTKFKDNSIPEEAITELLKIKNRTQQREEIMELLKMYKVEERKFDDLVTYTIREENKTIKSEKDFRLILIYRGETMLYGVLTNAHTVDVPKIKAEWEDGDFKVVYLYKPSAAQKELIENKILYTYLAL